MKALLVDDEILAIQLLEKAVNWKDLEVEIVGTALDGSEALVLIEKEAPDILITDIKMPEMNGLELIKWIKSKNLDIKIIILSAYGEFAYAQEALNYGVVGYLLKPLDERKLVEMIHKIICVVKREQIQGSNYLASKVIAEERILRQLLYPRNDLFKLQSLMSKLEIQVDFQAYILLNIQVDKLTDVEESQFDEARFILNSDIIDSIYASIYGNEAIVFENNPGEWIVLINCNTSYFQDLIWQTANEIAHRVVESLKSGKRVQSFISVSRLHSGIKELCDAYFETLHLLEYRFYFEEKAVLLYNDVKKDMNAQDTQINSHEELLLKYLHNGQMTETLEIIEQFFELLADNTGIEPERIYDYCYELLILFKQVLVKENIDLSMIADLKNLNFEALKQHKTFKNMKEYISNIAVQSITGIILNKSNGNPRLIQKAKEYIDRNYNTNISLDNICETIAVSKNHFCNVFKRETGESIWDYLTAVRINRAKELIIATNLKNYEISRQVGYENPSYFSKIFKMYTGVSPINYRNGEYCKDSK